MDDREFFLARRKAELPAFLGVLKALPADRLDYKPHENSPSAQQLAWTLTTELGAGVELAKTGATRFPTDPPPDLEAMIARFEKDYAALEEQVRTMDEAAWTRKGVLRSGDKVMMEPPIGEFLWFLLFDAIHHRGQLSAYLRPMGGKVPSIYGPSADTKRK